MKKILFTFLMVLFLATSAQAYLINFDQNGTGQAANLQEYDRWLMSAVPVLNGDTGTIADIFTYQGGDGSFDEAFSLSLDFGVLGLEKTPFTDLSADVYLAGQFFADDDIRFYLGNVSILKGATEIGSLTLQSALVSSLSGSLLGGGDLGMKVDLQFVFDSVDPLYFGPYEQYLVGQSWLLSLVGGRIEQVSLFDGAYDGSQLGDIIIGWEVTGFAAEFATVPEPSTIILLGAGLLGLVGLNRKKFFKK